MAGIILSERSWQRLKPLIEEPLNPENVYDETFNAPPNWQHVRVTGAALDCDEGSESYSGGERRYYPAVVEAWDSEEESPTDIGSCLILERHEYPLVVGNVYVGKQTGNKTVCGSAYSVFVTAIPVAGLEDSNASDDYYDYYDGSPDSADPGDLCEDRGESTAGGGITIPFNACDADGNPCQKELVINSPTPLRWCIRDPNGCGG